MPIVNLDLAIPYPFQQTGRKVDLAGFKSYIRLSYDDIRGWRADNLTLWQRLYYFVFSIFGASIEGENKSLLQRHVVHLNAEKLKEGGLGNRLLTLFEVHLTTPLPAESESSPHAPAAVHRATAFRPSRPAPALPMVVDSPAVERRLFAPHCAVKGIVNKGNSCWLNACCQVLFKLELFVDALDRKPVKGTQETDADFEKRKAICEILKATYKEYVRGKSDNSSRGEAIGRLREALYSLYEERFRGESLYSYQDSQEWMQTLLDIVMPESAPALPLTGNVSVKEALDNALIADSLWVKICTGLAQLLDPSYAIVYEPPAGSEVFSDALREAKWAIKEDLETAATVPFAEESDEDFEKRSNAVIALKALYKELEQQGGIQRANAKNERFNLDRLNRCIKEVEHSLKAIDPSISFTKREYQNLFDLVVEVLLPVAKRESVLTRYKKEAQRILGEERAPFLTEEHEKKYGFSESLFPRDLKNIFGVFLDLPSFICLNRIDLQAVNGFTLSVENEELRQAMANGKNEVEAPVILDLPSSLLEGQEAIYELVGVTHHHRGWGAQHYTATLNCQGKSVEADDSQVRAKNRFSVKSGFIIYRRIA